VSIFKACDIRGIVGVNLDESIARRIGLALGQTVRRHGQQRICLGGDYRRTTASLKQSVLTGLLKAGADVYDVGQLPTPVVYFAAAHLGCPNVAIVTASHNPGRYNGLKFMVAGRPATPTLVRELQSRFDAPVAPDRPGHAEQVDLLEQYESHVLTTAAATVGTPTSRLAVRRLKVVVDAMGGAFTRIAPRVLATCGCEVIALSREFDPDFTQRSPDPSVDRNLAMLSQRVLAERADLGIAFDGDGDRAAFVDNAGKIVRPEQMGALLVQRCFQHPKVVYDLKCASILVSQTIRAGGACLMQPSGHGFIKTAMIDSQADLGVEASGHYFFKALGGGDDGLFVSLVAALVVAGSGSTLAELIRPIGWPAITPDLRVPLPDGTGDVLERIAAGCGGEVTRLDGVRAEYADGWALARLSITEPLVTLRFEGRDHESLREIVARFLAGAPELYDRIRERIR
jgi:phosphomannomutase/phosphoglucomutase